MKTRTRPEAVIWWLRTACAVTCALNVALVTWGLAAGHVLAWNGGAAIFLLAAMAYQTRCLRRVRALNRPRPDPGLTPEQNQIMRGLPHGEK